MGLAAYEEGESLEQIVNDCERLAGNQGLNLDPVTKLPPTAGNLANAPAYRWILDIIRNLYLVHDWPFAIIARTLEIDSGTERCLCLPADFWRVAYTNPLYGLIANETRFSIAHVTRPQFFDNQGLANSTSRGRPVKFYLSRPDALIYLDPIPDQTYIYELHYFKLIEEIDDITFVPQFPYRDYLRQALLVKYYEDQNDSRAQVAEIERQQLFMRIRSSIYDYREDPIQMPNSMLDPQVFGTICFDD